MLKIVKISPLSRLYTICLYEVGIVYNRNSKRLYRSENIKAAYPDDNERIRHILREQVFGMAPTRIIYLIATNYILGFDSELKAETQNFVQADAAEAAKAGTLQALVDKYFGGKVVTQ